MPVKRALVSVYDKTNVVKLASRLNDMGWEIVSSSGTARHIEEAGIPVREVADLTGYPHMLGGRVKTLHPAVFGGILARRHFQQDMSDVETMGIPVIDLVACNLYPFREAAARGSGLEELLENIDIGGVTLIRAAAKNFHHVIPLVDPDDYERVMKECESEGNAGLQTRQELALKAFSLTSAYDSMIFSGIAASTGHDISAEDRTLPMALHRTSPLRYGENPHQKASLYSQDMQTPPWKMLSGKPLSYNNILDIDTALRGMSLFEGENACIIIKHTTPCGLAKGTDSLSAYRKALECDPVSAYGGIIGFSGKPDHATIMEMAGHFAEVVAAPAFEEESLAFLAASRPNLRVLQWNGGKAGSLQVTSTWSGFLVQEDAFPPLPEMRDGTWVGKPRPDLFDDLLTAWKTACLAKSNAISLVKDGASVGIGSGFTSRVDAVRRAVEQAGEKAAGSVMGSDAFFPFADGVEAAAAAGVSAVIQPGGSIRDQEVCEAANRFKVSMFLTGKRTFRH